MHRRQANIFFAFCFSIFEVGGIAKHLMAGLDPQISTRLRLGNIEGLGETKLTVSLGASH